MNPISDRILRRIRAKQRGWVFTPKHFIDLGSRNTVAVTLHRLVQKGLIRNIGHGLYDYPYLHQKLGPLAAAPDDIAKALAFKSSDAIQPSGAMLVNMLGLDQQVPAHSSYLTSGKSSHKTIGNYPIKMKHSKFLSSQPLTDNATRVVNALHYLGKNNITDDIIKKCKKILSQKDRSQLKKNLTKFPDWMVQEICKIVGK